MVQWKLISIIRLKYTSNINSPSKPILTQPLFLIKSPLKYAVKIPYHLPSNSIHGENKPKRAPLQLTGEFLIFPLFTANRHLPPSQKLVARHEPSFLCRVELSKHAAAARGES